MFNISSVYLFTFKKTAVLWLKRRVGLSFLFSMFFPVSSGMWSTSFLARHLRTDIYHYIFLKFYKKNPFNYFSHQTFTPIPPTQPSPV